jgi:ligand-binding sensor domain-containing protein
MNFKMRIIFSVISLLFFIDFCYSQEFKVDYFHGDNNVNSISIIGEYVWVGGFLGLTKINRLNYNEKDFIADPFVNHQDYCFSISAKKDNNGNLYVHDSYRLFKYISGSVVLIDSGASIIDFIIDENNTKWVLRQTGIVKIESTGEKTIYNSENSPLPDFNYKCIAVKNNEIFLGSDKGYIKFKGKSLQLFNTENSILPYNDISKIAIDQQNNIWLSCDSSGFIGYRQNYIHYNRVVKLAGTTGNIYDVFEPAYDGSVNEITIQNNAVYLCTTSGLMKFDGSAWICYSKEQNGLISNNIHTISFEDNKLWIGTDSGISVMSPDTIINFKVANATFSDITLEGPIIEDLTGNIWIGSGAGAYGDLSKFDGKKWETVKLMPRYNPQYISSLAVDKNNVVWATDYALGYLYKIDNDSVTVYNYENSPLPNPLIDMVVDKDNNKWIISNISLIKFDDTTWTVYDRDDFPELSYPSDIATDRKGNIWIALGQNGMVKFDGVNWVHYDNAFWGDEYSEVNTIFVDKDDNLWFEYSHQSIETRLCKFDGTTVTWYDEIIKIPANASDTRLLDVDKNGDIWYGYLFGQFNTGGFAKYDWNEWKFFNNQNSRFLTNIIWNFFIDSKGYKWISAGCYVARFNEDSLYSENIDSSVFNGNKFYLYPNPCNNYINLKSSGNIEYVEAIKVYDSKGSFLHNYSFHSTSYIELNLSEYNSGIYLIQIIGKDFVEMHKIIKIH